MLVVKVFCTIETSPWALTLTEPVPEAFELPASDWPEKFFSGQSEAGNSNASGTGSVRVSAQGLVSIVQKTFTTNILSTRLTAPGSPRMAYL